MPNVRIDAGQIIRKPYRSPQGHLRVDCHATRTGVFRYYNEDGSYRDELRHPDQVFDPKSLATLGGVPVTLLHPPELASPENFGKYGTGTVGDEVDATLNPFVRVTLNVQRADAQKAIESGIKEVSLGYLTDSIEESGVWEGQPYTHRQIGVEHKDGRYIEYNHLAIVPQGRAGSNVRIHFDGADVAVSVPFTNKPMSTLRIDEHQSFDGIDPAVAAAVSARFTRDAAAIAELQDRVNKAFTMLGKLGYETVEEALAGVTELKAMLEQVKGENKALEEEAGQAKAEVEEVKGALEMAKADSADINARVQARIELLQAAARLVPASTKLDGLSDREIKMAAITAKYPDIKLDDATDEHIQGMWLVAARTDSTGTLREAATTAQAPAPQREDGTAEDARDQMSAKRTALKTRSV